MKNTLTVVLVGALVGLGSYVGAMVNDNREWGIIHIIVVLGLLVTIISAGVGIAKIDDEEKLTNAKIDAIVKRLNISNDDIKKELHK